MPRKKRVIAKVLPNKKGDGIYQTSVENGTVNDINNIILLREAGKVYAEVVDIDKAHPEKFAFQVPDPVPVKDISKNAKPQAVQLYKWIWSIPHGRPEFTGDNANKGLGEAESISPQFSVVVEGGGLGWLEPFLPKGNPVNRIPNGYFVAAKGTPKILSAEWREYNEMLDGKIITKTTQDLSNSVVLDIYTQGLFGQYINIELLGKSKSLTDWTDDNLPLYEPEYTSPQAKAEAAAAEAQNIQTLEPVVVVGKRKSPSEKEPEEKIEETPPLKSEEKEKKYEALATFFKRQITIYKMLEDEKGRGSGKQVSDFLAPVKKETQGKTTDYVRYNYVQKTKLLVYLDARWLPIMGDSVTEIYPKITIPSIPDDKGTALEGDYITITGKISDSPNVKYSGNVPVLVGDIPTNPQKFMPCKYAIIKVKDNDKLYIIFNESILDYKENSKLIHEIVAGEDAAKQTITLTLEQVVTNDDDCKNNPKHKGHVILPDDLLKAGYTPEDEKNKRPEEKKKGLVTTELKGTISGPGKAAHSVKSDGIKSFTKIIKQSDAELVFDAMYHYTMYKQDGSIDWSKVWGYFWLPSVKTDSYTVKTQTCRWQHDITFIIYPDIKWSLVFGFNVDKGKLQSLIPSWSADKTIKSFEKQGETVTEKIDKGLDKFMPKAIDPKEREATNKGMSDAFQRVFETKEKPKEDKPVKGKLSTLIDILKDVEVSLKAEWNGGKQKEDFTRDFVKSIYNATKEVFDLVKKAAEIIDGKHDTPKKKSEGDDKINKYIKENEFNVRYQHLIESLKRPAQEIEIIYPKFQLGFSWLYETVDATKDKSLEGRKGLGVDVKIEASPLVGIQFTWHILDLLCRRHPIAYAILAGVKTILAALGDNPDGIKIDLWVKGSISGEIDYQHNLLAGFKEATAKSATSVQAGLIIELKLKTAIVTGKYEVVGNLGFGAAAQVGMGTEDLYGVDNNGIYLQKKLLFEGIKLSFEVVAESKVNKLKVDEKGNVERDEIFGIGGKIEGEVTLAQHTFETPKIYFKKFDNAS